MSRESKLRRHNHRAMDRMRERSGSPTEPRPLMAAICEAARIEASRTSGYRHLRSDESWNGKEYRVREKITRSAFRRLMQIRRLARVEDEARASSPQPDIDVDRLQTTNGHPSDHPDYPLTVQAVSLLRRLVLHEDVPCRLDHHGNCQEHNLENPCTIAEARAFLRSLPSEPPPAGADARP